MKSGKSVTERKKQGDVPKEFDLSVLFIDDALAAAGVASPRRLALPNRFCLLPTSFLSSPATLHPPHVSPQALLSTLRRPTTLPADATSVCLLNTCQPMSCAPCSTPRELALVRNISLPEICFTAYRTSIVRSFIALSS